MDGRGGAGVIRCIGHQILDDVAGGSLGLECGGMAGHEVTLIGQFRKLDIFQMGPIWGLSMHWQAFNGMTGII
jgi:hypothetical protein